MERLHDAAVPIAGREKVSTVVSLLHSGGNCPTFSEISARAGFSPSTANTNKVLFQAHRKPNRTINAEFRFSEAGDPSRVNWPPASGHRDAFDRTLQLTSQASEGVVFVKKWAFLALAAVLFASFAGAASAKTSLMAEIEPLLGTKYAWGGTTTKGFDCSGFTMYVFAKFNIQLPHSSKLQAKQGEKVEKDKLRPGDLVFFDTGGNGISHVGIFIGDGKFAHASTDDGVVITDLDDKYYAKRYVTARRILDEKAYQKWAAEDKKAAETRS